MALTNGKLKSVFSLKVGTQDWVSDIVSFELTSDEAEQDAMTFAEYNAGTNRTWVLSVSAAWDGGSADSLHSYLWDNAGTTATFEVQPSQGVVSATKPKYTGSVRIPFRPDISVEAGNESTFDYEFEVVGEPNKVISAT
ncbi:major tail protein [Rhodococcus phage Peregrin]|jgi:hypothetical protein|nr:major tail protein [Rhodococcus phage Peregrin]AWN04427.1 major tail protein [Rhodococcus phage Grayson]